MHYFRFVRDNPSMTDYPQGHFWGQPSKRPDGLRLRQLRLERINFAAAHVAHYERRTIGSDAIPGVSRVTHQDARNTFSATTRSFFAPITVLTTAT